MTYQQMTIAPTRVLHGPGIGPWAGPARSPMAGPGRAGRDFNDILRAGPGAGLKLAGPAGLVNNNFAGCGPGLCLTFLGLGRARAYSENQSCFNKMVKDDPRLTFAIRSLFSMLSM